MNIEELQNQWDIDCNIDENHLGTEAIETPKLHAKYLRLLIQIKLKHAKLQADIAVLRKTKFRYYRGELSREELSTLNWDQWQGIKPLKNEMEEFLDGDSDLTSAGIKLQYLNTMLYTLESIMTALKARDWQIKTSLDHKKFLAGI